jgi:HlyD family secretion protein
MNGRYVLPVLATAGFAAAIAAAGLGSEAPPAAPAPQPSAKAPYQSYVAGTGLIEASTGNITIGTPVSGIVDAIYVKWGDWVNTGQPLFKLEARDLSAQMEVAAARVEEAQANADKTKNLLKVGEGLTSGSGISAVDLANRRYDVGIADAAVAVAKAQADQIDVDIGRHIIRAPVDGRVLQINTHLGEFAQSGAVSPPLMLFGNDKRLNIRVDVDETDAWRVQPTAAAKAFVPGNPQIGAPLKFERIESYVVPKTSLTGASTERTDTRVLQVIYSFDHGTLPVYIGQRMNVFIEAPPVPTANDAGRGTSDQVASELNRRSP